ncbi:MAG: translocation/assembly module TamB domain-containing protein [Rhodospirillales bacterium]
MSRKSKITLYVLGGLTGAALALVVCALTVVQTGWFREKVRQRIITEAENATGGRVEIGAFDFDWRTLTADVRDLVIHGTEPPGEAPLFRAGLVRVGLKILSLSKKQVDIALLVVNRPQVNVIVFEDGRTNMPRPKAVRNQGNPVQTVLDLAIKRFELVDGTARLAAHRIPLHVAGENVRAQVLYDAGPPRYRGEISLQQLDVAALRRAALPLDVNANLVLAGNRLEIGNVHVGLKDSSLDVKGELTDFASPQTALQYTARIEMKDVAPVLGVAQIPGRGRFELSGTAASGAEPFKLSGKLQGSGLAFEERNLRIRNIGVAANLELTPERLELGGLRISALGGQFSGRAGIAGWKRFEVDGQIRDYSLEELMRLESTRPLAWNGLISGPFSLAGEIQGKEVRNTTARARLTLTPAPGANPAEGMVNVSYSQAEGSLDFGRSYIATRYSRAQFAGTLGRRLEVAVNSTNLEDFEPAIAMFSSGPPQRLPVKLQDRGTARFQGIVSGALDDPTIQGRAAAARFEIEGQTIELAEADVILSKSGVALQNATVAKEGIRAAGTLRAGFRNWKPDMQEPVAAEITLRAASIPALLAGFGQKAPVTGGSLTAEVKVEGTMGAPRASGSAEVLKVTAWEQPFDSIRGQFQYTKGLLKIASGQVQSGKGRLDFSGAYEHQGENWREGRLRFEVVTGGIPLTEIRAVRASGQPVQGRIEMHMAGEAALTNSGFRPGPVNGWIAVKDIAMNGDRLGSLLLTASGKGEALNARLEGDFAGSKLNGEAELTLNGDIPMQGRAEFKDLAIAPLLRYFGSTAGEKPPLDGVVAGRLTFSGLGADRQTWKGALELPLLELCSNAGVLKTAAKELTFRNAGPVLVDFTAREARVRQAQFRARDTELTVTGSVRFGVKSPLDLRFRGGFDMQLLQLFDQRITSEGEVALDVSVRGAPARPDVYGRVDLRKASLNFEGLPNGIDNANGLIFLYRDRATIDSITAESGGGKVAITGFVNFGELKSFHLQAEANEVRVRYPEGVSSSMNAKLTFTGTAERSLLAGDVVVTRIGFNPRSDLGSLLARSVQPVRATTNAGSFERGLHFDVHVVTSPQVRLETQLTRDVQADADLRLRGDIIRPVLLGRISINQGDVVFFGNKYTINSGQILFVNAAKIEPIVNLDLETKARAVEITLHVAGPVDKLNVSYRSDPPLSFPEIVALLTTGREPAASAAASGPQTQQAQTWQQAGASALLSQAIANPIAGRLQRFFGVSRLKIDPQITGVNTNNAAARVTLEQQVASNLTFTYITDLSRAQAQTVRVELNFTKDWSAVALREENGLFGIDFLYRKQFK